MIEGKGKIAFQVKSFLVMTLSVECSGIVSGCPSSLPDMDYWRSVHQRSLVFGAQSFISCWSGAILVNDTHERPIAESCMFLLLSIILSIIRRDIIFFWKNEKLWCAIYINIYNNIYITIFTFFNIKHRPNCKNSLTSRKYKKHMFLKIVKQTSSFAIRCLYIPIYL